MIFEREKGFGVVALDPQFHEAPKAGANELGQVAADELTPRQRAALNARQHRKGISPEGRERLREAAQRNRPWVHSTGPKTPEGKAMSSRNAVTHGMSVQLRLLADERRDIQRWLAALDLDDAQALFRTAVSQHLVQ